MLSALGADRARVAEINAEIEALEPCLERSLSTLTIEKRLVVERLNSCNPVFKLPNEIVTEIFFHFLPIYPLCPPLAGIHSPTILSQICREWRGIALATPTLWRAISLSNPSIPFERQVHLAGMSLSRSRYCPLSLQLDEVEDTMHVTAALSAVVPHRARWEHLALHLPLSHLPTIPGPMPLLRHLNLHAIVLEEDYDEEDYDDPSFTTTRIAFCEAPLLRTAILNHTAAEHIILPWAQLTSLTLDAVYPRDCVPILRQTSNLVHCQLNIVDCFHENLPDIALPSLLSLTVDNPYGGWVTWYLETLIVPALCTLKVPASFLGRNPIDKLALFISKSSCKLQEVCITGRRKFSAGTYRKAFPLMKFSFTHPSAADEEESDSDVAGISSSQ